MKGQELNTDIIDYSNYTIHIVDDSPLIITALTNILKPMNFNVNSSVNGEEALKSIHLNLPNLIILDIEMPVMNGYETISNIKRDRRTKHIPVIFLTSITKPDSIKKIFDLGASDYITKPFIVEEITARIEKEIRNIMLQNLLKEKMSKLAELLSIDSLTKTSNKMHMTSIIKRNLQKVRDKEIHSFFLMYVDIDNFDAFIRANGINATDATIKKVSMIIKRSIRDKDILAYWHGDKFMIYLNKVTNEAIDTIAKTIRENVSKASFSSNGHITCSICTGEITTNENVTTVIDRFQNSMKNSKETNKSSIVKIMDFCI